jgi:hypothetical protein
VPYISPKKLRRWITIAEEDFSSVLGLDGTTKRVKSWVETSIFDGRAQLIHPITDAEYVRFVGCNCSFYPGVGPILVLKTAIISARGI